MRKIAVSLGLGSEFDHARPTHVPPPSATSRVRRVRAVPSSPPAPLVGVPSCNNSYEGSDLVPLYVPGSPEMRPPSRSVVRL